MKESCLIKLTPVSISQSKKRIDAHSTVYVARTASSCYATDGLHREAPGTIISRVDA